MEIDSGSPFATSKLISLSASPCHLKTSKSDKQSVHRWEILAAKLKVFPEGDDTGAFIVPALDRT